MLQATRGLVFHVSRFSESAGIVKIFTEEMGLQSVIIKSLFSRNSKIRPALFGHLVLLDLVIDLKTGRSLNYVREASLNRPFHDITDHMGKSTILLFMNEMLYKSVKEEESNKPLFNFIEYSLQTLNDIQFPIHSFHLLFLIQLSEYLGFGISQSITASGDYFDMLSGMPHEMEPSHSYYIHGDSLSLLKKLSKMEYSQLEDFDAPRAVRLDLLDKLLDFYRIHLPGMTELKSVKILHELMS